MAKASKKATKEWQTPIRVDVQTCERLAHMLTSRPIPIDREESSLVGFSRVEVADFYFLLVAICHQTSPRGRLPLEGRVGEKRLRGWDYMSAKLEVAVRSNPSLLTPVRWATMSLMDFITLFHDSELGDRISEPERRVALVNNLGQVMLNRGWKSLDDLYQLCEGRAATGKPNLFELLSHFSAYRDPVRKKSSFLLSLMRNSGLWVFPDEDQIGPPVDYHEVRGHLRLGTVIVTDPELSRKLFESEMVSSEEDVLIRGAVYDAIMYLSEITELRNPSQLHYLFWNVFRSHCLREEPLCYHSASLLPERYQHLTVFGNDHCCPFVEVCNSANSSQRYYEHVFETDYY